MNRNRIRAPGELRPQIPVLASAGENLGMLSTTREDRVDGHSCEDFPERLAGHYVFLSAQMLPPSRPSRPVYLLACLMLQLAACGGGGSADGSQPQGIYASVRGW